MNRNLLAAVLFAAASWGALAPLRAELWQADEAFSVNDWVRIKFVDETGTPHDDVYYRKSDRRLNALIPLYRLTELGRRTVVIDIPSTGDDKAGVPRMEKIAHVRYSASPSAYVATLTKLSRVFGDT